jgi:aspartate-semialdehyde dehydrogenase
MKVGRAGYRIGISGASSLLGKELLEVLEQRAFPVSRLVTLEAEGEDPGLPIVDLTDRAEVIVAEEEVKESELDFVFLASPRLPRFLASPPETGTGGAAEKVHRPCVVIDLGEAATGTRQRLLAGPLLDPASYRAAAGEAGSAVLVTPHPAAMTIGSLLLRIAARYEVKVAVAHVFSPASEIGPSAIDELQKQTVNLLSFQKIPRGVFGAQIAFNVLPRIGHGQRDALSEAEARVRGQLAQYLRDRVPVPALRFFQAPVFYSMAVSLYVETAQPLAPEKVKQAVAGDRIRVARLSERAPSQAEVTGTSDILVDAILPDAGRLAGVWIWAVVDNLRLAATSAVEIAEAASSKLPLAS